MIYFKANQNVWFKIAAILIGGKQRECAVKPLMKQAVITLNFFLEEILTCIKHFSINIMHTMFQFSKSKRLLSHDQFFYKILIGKLHCFLPIRLLRDVTTNFLYHISSNNYRTYKKTSWCNLLLWCLLLNFSSTSYWEKRCTSVMQIYLEK